MWNLNTSGCKHGKVDNYDPCLVLSESDSKLYTNFEFCEQKHHRYFIKILLYTTQQIVMTRKIYVF
jgi:hypothetical protein